MLREDETRVRPPDSGELDLPAAPDEEATTPSDETSGGVASRSLFDDFEALIDDARLYIDAELSYQKTRAGFVANRLKQGIAFAAAAGFVAVLALIGLTVGLIIALTPLVTAWGATAIVVGVLLLLAYLILRKSMRAFNELSSAMGSEGEEGHADV